MSSEIAIPHEPARQTARQHAAQLRVLDRASARRRLPRSRPSLPRSRSPDDQDRDEVARCDLIYQRGRRIARDWPYTRCRPSASRCPLGERHQPILLTRTSAAICVTSVSFDGSHCRSCDLHLVPSPSSPSVVVARSRSSPKYPRSASSGAGTISGTSWPIAADCKPSQEPGPVTGFVRHAKVVLIGFVPFPPWPISLRPQHRHRRGNGVDLSRCHPAQPHAPADAAISERLLEQSTARATSRCWSPAAPRTRSARSVDRPCCAAGRPQVLREPCSAIVLAVLCRSARDRQLLEDLGRRFGHRHDVPSTRDRSRPSTRRSCVSSFSRARHCSPRPSRPTLPVENTARVDAATVPAVKREVTVGPAALTERQTAREAFCTADRAIAPYIDSVSRPIVLRPGGPGVLAVDPPEHEHMRSGVNDPLRGLRDILFRLCGRCRDGRSSSPQAAICPSSLAARVRG